MGNIEKFDQIANLYDTPERVKISGIIADEIKKHIIDGKEKQVIDYGCGTGLIGMQLLDDVKFTLFIDASNHMVEQVKQKMEQLNVRNVKAICCDFEQECPEELYADYVILAQTLLHIKGIKPILTSLYKVLNLGGHLLITDFDKNNAVISDDVHHGFDQEKLIEVLIEIGFVKAEAKTFYHGKKMFMNQDASLFILDAVK